MNFSSSYMLRLLSAFEETLQSMVKTWPQKDDYDGTEGHVGVDFQAPDLKPQLAQPLLVVNVSNFFDDGEHWRDVALHFEEPEIGNPQCVVVVVYGKGNENRTHTKQLYHFQHPGYVTNMLGYSEALGQTLALECVSPFLHHGELPDQQQVQKQLLTLSS